MIERFSITRVVTKNIAVDSFQSIRNFFGLRLRGYEGMINKHTNALIEEAQLRFEIKWFRMSINPLAKGAVMITIYGEGKRR